MSGHVRLLPVHYKARNAECMFENPVRSGYIMSVQIMIMLRLGNAKRLEEVVDMRT